MPDKTAILLTNLGTPDRLSKSSIKRFLKQFLSDPWVVELPRLPWWILLNCIILPFRSPKTLKAYTRIWGEQGSPLLVIAKQQQAALQQQLGSDLPVALAMRYGNPDFETVIDELLGSGVNHLVVLPLYPQNSATTSATTFHYLAKILTRYRALPSISFIDNYHDHPAYIEALAESVTEHWEGSDTRNHLLMSFHGLPQVNVDKGDPYYAQCLVSANLLADALGLGKSDWSLSFQSRFGRQVWLKPYTSDVLNQLVRDGIKAVDVICPGFSADCLETLDEIQNEYREFFLAQGGESFHYIPALNARARHISMMQALVTPYLAVTEQ